MKDGFTKLGFTGGGGGTNPACCRFGYGFAQGANAAAKELGETVDTELLLAVRRQLQRVSANCRPWSRAGTKPAPKSCSPAAAPCLLSVTAAAAENDGFVVGVDVDQSSESETVVTSAMKGLAGATEWAIAKFYDGEWDQDRRRCAEPGRQ